MYNLWSLHTWSTRNKIFISIVRGCTPTSKSFIGDIRIYINACYAEKNQRRKFLYNWKNLTSNYNISVIDVIKLRTKLRQNRITEYNEKDASPVRPRDWLNYASVSRREKKKKYARQRATAADFPLHTLLSLLPRKDKGFYINKSLEKERLVNLDARTRARPRITYYGYTSLCRSPFATFLSIFFLKCKNGRESIYVARLEGDWPPSDIFDHSQFINIVNYVYR